MIEEREPLLLSIAFNIKVVHKFELETKLELEKISKTVTYLLNSNQERDKEIKKLVNNLDYIKNQNETIINSIIELRNILPSREDLENLSYLLETNKPKKIELETKKAVEQLNNKIKEFDSQISSLLAEVKDILIN